MKNNITKNTTKYIVSIVFTIFLTVLWVKAWVWLTASSWDKLDYQKWNELVSTVQSWIPTWAVMAFNLAWCPSGWTEFTNAKWRTIIWVGQWSWLKNRTLLEAWGWEAAVSYTSTWNTIDVIPWSTAYDPAPNISNYMITWVTGSAAWPVSTGSLDPNTKSSIIWVHVNIEPIADQTWLSPSTDNMQPYVALLYCVKN